MKDSVVVKNEFTLEDFREMVIELNKRENKINPYGLIHVSPQLQKDIDKAMDEYFKSKLK